MGQDRQHDRDETPAERADRNWSELLQELRVSQTGTQLLAAFLISLPFQSRFTELDSFQVWWYLGTLGLAFLTVGVTLAPVAIHRRLFGGGSKPEIVQAAHVLTGMVLGLIVLLVTAISVFVVDVVINRSAAAVAGIGSLVVLLFLLVALPRLVARSAKD